MTESGCLAEPVRFLSLVLQVDLSFYITLYVMDTFSKLLMADVKIFPLETKTGTWMFMAALFLKAKTGSNPNIHQLVNVFFIFLNVVHPYSEILLNKKKTTDTCLNVNEPQKHYIKWKA